MNLILLDKIHDIHIVDMQKQGMIFEMNYIPCMPPGGGLYNILHVHPTCADERF